MKRGKWNKEKCKMYPVLIIAPGKLMEPNSVLTEIKSLKKDLLPHRIKAVVTLGQVPTKEGFQLIKRN